MAKIDKVWFDTNRIYLLTDIQLTRPLNTCSAYKSVVNELLVRHLRTLSPTPTDWQFLVKEF